MEDGPFETKLNFVAWCKHDQVQHLSEGPFLDEDDAVKERNRLNGNDTGYGKYAVIEIDFGSLPMRVKDWL